MIFTYDVIVIGAGHAGCEAAHAAAKLGAKTCLITLDMNKIAQMSCNPAVGGIAKGQIVREIDALGGMMGIVTDACTLQFRMLNRSKGPAMWSPRAQCDREKFIRTWRHILENTDNLDMWQDEVIDVQLLESQEHRLAIITAYGAIFHTHTAIVTAGTFLNGLMHVGRVQIPGGRCAEPAATKLTAALNKLGITHDRMKTGTPVRIDGRTVDFSLMEKQDGERDFHRFSYSPTPNVSHETATRPCWITNTNKECHDILLSGLKDSPLYNGQIQSIGPRYCPSVETKLVTFEGRDSHPLFLEPEGEDTNEWYLQGFSSSLPLDVQIEALKKVPAFRHLKVYRPGYAIEYDFFDPTQLHHSLESKKVEGLFFAGQVNGTTGYEEAAGQGLIAGVNAARKCQGKETVILKRNEAYIGVLIDDLVTKGVDEPYRMFTSRAEYRILLRSDNADQRLSDLGIEIGLLHGERADFHKEKMHNMENLMNFCKDFSVKPEAASSYLNSIDSPQLSHAIRLYEFLTRPNVHLQDLKEILPELKTHLSSVSRDTENVIEAVEILIKYDGYITRERALAEKMERLENIKIAGKFDYTQLTQLSTEARQKLQNIQPATLAQASRIPGVSPNDVSVLMILAQN